MAAVERNVSLNLDNIKRDFFNSNKTALLEALRKDIAYVHSIRFYSHLMQHRQVPSAHDIVYGCAL